MAIVPGQFKNPESKTPSDPEFSFVTGDRDRPINNINGAAKADPTIFCKGLLLRSTAPTLPCAAPETIAKSTVEYPDRRGAHHLPHWWIAIMSIVRVAPELLPART